MKKLTFLTFILLIFALPSFARQGQSRGAASGTQPDSPMKIEFDLASAVNSLSFQVKNGTAVDLILTNLLPSKKYSIDVVSQMVLPPALDVPDTRSLKSDCKILETAFKAAKSEVEFSQVLLRAKTGCKELYDYYLGKSSREFKLGTFSNEKKTITISDQDGHKWTISIETQVNGKIVLLYGFSFIPYAFSKPKTYYALPIATTPGSYTIGRGSSESRYEYAPTVAFHYIGRQANNFSSSFSLGLGIGFNTSTVTPVVMAGYSALIYKNFGINVGVAGHTINRLKPKYTEGQVITTNLESADLIEKVIRFNPVVSFTFRFGSWPFAQRNEPGQTTINP